MLIAPILRAGRQAERVSAARQLDESGDQRGDAGAAHDHGGNASRCRCSRATAPSCRWIRRDGMALHYFPEAGRRVFPAGGRHRRILAGACGAGAGLSCGWRSSRRKIAITSGWCTTWKGRAAWSLRIANTVKWRRSPGYRPHLVLRCGAEELSCQGEGESRRGLHHQSELRVSQKPGHPGSGSPADSQVQDFLRVIHAALHVLALLVLSARRQRLGGFSRARPRSPCGARRGRPSWPARGIARNPRRACRPTSS